MNHIVHHHEIRPARDALVGAIVTFLSGQDLLTLDDIRHALEREIDEAGPSALVSLKARLTDADEGWTYCPRDPLAQRIHHVLADKLLEPQSALEGAAHLALVADEPVVIFANHLSYADANLLEILLHRHGAVALANRLTAIAGPKVFTSRTRRFSSLCFATIKTAQSADVATGEAVMSARDVARAARQAIDTAAERLRQGDAIVMFAEGARSRTGAMQRMLPAVTRYLDDVDSWVLPVGLCGPEALFPVGDTTLHRVRVTARVGRPFRASALRAHARGDRRLAIDAIGLAIADVLPPGYRGAYAEPSLAPDAARKVLDAL